MRTEVTLHTCGVRDVAGYGYWLGTAGYVLPAATYSVLVGARVGALVGALVGAHGARCRRQ